MINDEEVTRQDKLDFFHTLFAEEFDSIFSADIICCENCIDEFINYWPGIYINDLDFQTHSISISSLYSMMRFSDFITEEEYNEFSSEMICPRCEQKLNGVIYPYNMPFEVPNGFEQLIEEIARISYETPFLLLSHPYALKVYNEVSKIALTTQPTFFSKSLFRARSYNKDSDYTVSDFLAPPKEYVVEGRYNHAGKQVYYLSEEPETCFFELRTPELGVMIASIQIKEPIKILDLTLQSDESSIINLARWSSLMSSPQEGEGWYKPHYVFTRFVSDCARAAGFDAIRYPSIRSDEGMNLAVIKYEKYVKDINVKKIFFYDESKTKSNMLFQNLKNAISLD